MALIVLGGALAISACTDDAERSAATTTTAVPAGHVEFHDVTFDVPAEWPVTVDAFVFACRTNDEPGVFLGEGYGFCPFNGSSPPGPSVYVGPYYQTGTEDGDLVAPSTVPSLVEMPPGMSTAQVGGRTVWVRAERTIIPDLNLEFAFVGVDPGVREAVIASATRAG